MNIPTRLAINTDDARSMLYIPPQSVLYITSSFQIHMITPKPNRWHRFWYRVLLGWKWTDV